MPEITNTETNTETTTETNTTKKREFPFMLGADPEFNIMSRETRIPAIKLFPILFEGKKIKAKDNMGYVIENAGSVGWDGASHTGEIRPNPSKSPDELTNNIGTLFKSIVEYAGMFELSTKCEVAPIGGHIHFDLPKEYYSSNKKMNILNKKLGIFYLPIQLGEDILNCKMRTRLGYGKIGDYSTSIVETSTHQKYLFEYRCPSAEWTINPKIATATLAYLGTVYHEIINNTNAMKKAKDLYIQNEAQMEALQGLTLSRYTIFLKEMMFQIKKAVRTFEHYEMFKNEIEFIFKPAKILKEKEKVEYEITKGWKLVTEKTPNKKELLSKKKWIKKANNINIDILSEAISIPYNPNDTKAADFAKELKDRIVAFNWKTHYNYFIFGLRQGVKNYIISTANLEIIDGKEQIETLNDREIIMSILRNIETKYLQAIKRNTRLTTEEKNKIVFVGIPYEERITLNTKNFLEKIHKIEKNKEKGCLIDNLELKSTANGGDLYQIYCKDSNQNLITQSDIDSSNNARMATNSIRASMEHEERNNIQYDLDTSVSP